MLPFCHIFVHSHWFCHFHPMEPQVQNVPLPNIWVLISQLSFLSSSNRIADLVSFGTKSRNTQTLVNSQFKRRNLFVGLVQNFAKGLMLLKGVVTNNLTKIIVSKKHYRVTSHRIIGHCHGQNSNIKTEKQIMNKHTLLCTMITVAVIIDARDDDEPTRRAIVLCVEMHAYITC